MTIEVQEVDETTRDLAGGDDASRDEPVSLRYQVAGRLDADASREVRNIERDPPADSVVEIDLERCSDIDAFGFGSLVGLIRRARENQARVELWGANEKLRDQLRRTGVARLVDLMPYPEPQR